jgi:nitrogen fixation-related uncharacterized protein
MIFQIMNTLFWILVIIVIIAIGTGFLFWAISKGIFRSSSTKKESDSIDSVKNFLAFDFGNDYEVVEHISTNFHPDQPTKISVKLDAKAIGNTKSFLLGLSLVKKESISDDNKIKYIETWRNDKDVFQKTHTASHLNSDGTGYTFFKAELKIDLESMIITYVETGY